MNDGFGDDMTWLGSDPFGNRGSDEPEASGRSATETRRLSAKALAALEPSWELCWEVLVVGPRLRLATINGEACTRATYFRCPTSSTKVEPRLSSCEDYRQGVQIESSGRIFTLELNQPKLGHGDEWNMGSEGKPLT